MKTHFLIIALVVFSGLIAQEAKAQNGVNVVTVNATPAEVFVGRMNKTHTGGCEKLKVDVFGGSWGNDNLGLTTYYISTRNGVKINMERHGGDGTLFQLKIYDGGSYYDFTIARSSHTYCSYTVESQQLHQDWYITPMIPVAVASYTPSGLTDVTNQFPINILFATDNNGNIGIGTNLAQGKLDVNGTIRAKEVKIELANWPDYVFSDDYQLPSLEDVSLHIKENKHLPGIPSASEVEEKGVNLGEMNAKLLQKVEELTLYLIEQNQEIKKQNQEIKKLEQEVKAITKD